MVHIDAPSTSRFQYLVCCDKKVVNNARKHAAKVSGAEGSSKITSIFRGKLDFKKK